MGTKKKSVEEKCVLCGAIFKHDWLRCDPSPILAEGKCCWKCDNTKVTPARLMQQGVPQEEAKTIGRNLQRAVVLARKRWRRNNNGKV